ncbi:hypothetical protein KIN20_037165 [Parelaphostrongylus tenuis]|uniref:Uncharacterized protein n=1 Tax=Parelaphostrongylus tenuis TaxID=148309 RepID=A0AAD5RHF6_PARTN|nr:hypothetical protein KIN20_037165 [Parelaphostrongylus tenuis]
MFETSLNCVRSNVGFSGAARTPSANNDRVVDDQQQQHKFSIKKLRDGRIMVVIGTDAAKRIVSLRGTSLFAWLYLG